MWIRIFAVVVLFLAPLWGTNLMVSLLGHSWVFPLSPFFLREKLAALRTYAGHRATCWVTGHPDIGPLIAAAEIRYHLPRHLLAAVIQVESNGRPHRISAAGAMGPAQLMPDTARLLAVADPFDSAAAVDGAARLLRRHLDHFHAVRLAIAAYHAGPAAVRGGVPQNGMTPEYVSRVISAYRVLRRQARTAAAATLLTEKKVGS
jgi:soluble lytic murein transglycosylase-like protein